jgi:hypothetical protein
MGEFMDLAAAEYAFNDNIYRRVATQIKDALDPDGSCPPAGTVSGRAPSADPGRISLRTHDDPDTDHRLPRPLHHRAG